MATLSKDFFQFRAQELQREYNSLLQSEGAQYQKNKDQLLLIKSLVELNLILSEHF